MIEDYVRWLVGLYAERAGAPLNDLGAVEAGVRVLNRHAARLPRGEDFVSLAAAEMADRLRRESTDAEPLPPFLTLLDRSADAVRHRIVRAARKRPVPTSRLEDVPARPDFLEGLPDALTTGLSPEEHLVVQALLCGNKPDEVARRLGISLRTVYRRIEKIKQRLMGDSCPRRTGPAGVGAMPLAPASCADLERLRSQFEGASRDHPDLRHILVMTPNSEAFEESRRLLKQALPDPAFPGTGAPELRDRGRAHPVGDERNSCLRRLGLL